MSAHRNDAVVLRRTRFSESSLVVVLFSRERGRIDALAKGCRRPRSAMYGHLDLYNREDVLVLDRSRGGLDLVTETDLIDEYVGLRRRPLAFAVAGLAAELLLAGCMIHDPHPRAFDLFTGGLRALSDGASPLPVGVRLMLGVLDDLGFHPRLDACADCGGPLPQTGGGVLSPRRGGLVCPACATQAHGEAIRPRAFGALCHLARTADDLQGRIALPSADGRALITLLSSYAEEVLARGLRSPRILMEFLRRNGDE